MKEISDMTDAEFDEAYGGRELVSIEQLAYEREGAERFAKYHGSGRSFPKQAEHDVERWVASLNAKARAIDASFEATHPEVALEQSKADTEKWKQLAKGGA